MVHHYRLKAALVPPQRQRGFHGLPVFEHVEEQFMNRLIGDGQRFFVEHEGVRFTVHPYLQAAPLQSVDNSGDGLLEVMGIA